MGGGDLLFVGGVRWIRVDRATLRRSGWCWGCEVGCFDAGFVVESLANGEGGLGAAGPGNDVGEHGGRITFACRVVSLR